MRTIELDRLLAFFAGMGLLAGLLWLGLAVLTVCLLILMRTRWGQSRPLRKCVILSLLAHVLLAGYATTVQIVAAYPPPGEPVIHLSLVDGSSEPPDESLDAPEDKPWEQFPHEAISLPEQVEPQRQEYPQPPEPQRRDLSEPDDLSGDLPLDHLALAEAEQPEPEPLEVDEPADHYWPAKAPEEIEAPAAESREAPAPDLPEALAPERAALPGQPEPTPVRALADGPARAIHPIAAAGDRGDDSHPGRFTQRADRPTLAAGPVAVGRSGHRRSGLS
jgi:hypothetical protein